MIGTHRRIRSRVVDGAAVFVLRSPRRWPLLLLPSLLILTGCLERVAGPASPAPGQPVATVPRALFEATPYAPCCPTPPPRARPERYSLGTVTRLAAGKDQPAWVAPVVGQAARVVRVTLRIDGLREPRTPLVHYELVTNEGVFGALADGEWEPAVPASDGTYWQEGTLLFVVPRDARAGQLAVVDYYYPRVPAAAGGVGTTTASEVLARDVIASFALDRLP